MQVKLKIFISFFIGDLNGVVKKAIIAQLNIPRPVLTYAGQQKTVGGNPVPQSPPKASGNLIANTNVYWKEGFEQGKPELIVEMPDYYFFVENGRRPGKYPPLAKVRQWAQVKKGISRYLVAINNFSFFTKSVLLLSLI